jgi:tetratricopeptide (TPR) repeat protein
MRSPAALPYGIVSALFLLAAMPRSLSADTIYLKNGRTIAAAHVTQENGQISYETPAGHLSLPASIVDRVVRDGQSDPAPGAPNDRAANLPLAPPNTRTPGSNEELAHAVVHDGSIDLELLHRMESAADGNASPAALAQMLAAEEAAAQFEISRGDFDRALTFYSTGLRYAPNNMNLLLDSAYLRLRRSEYSSALDLLGRAKRLEPDSPDSARLAGWAYYGLNRIADSVSEWKRALALRPDPDIQRALERAMRDAEEEAGYREGETSHFRLRYNGAAVPELAHEVQRTLEGEFGDISAALNYSPPEPIGVILYTNQVFADITRVPSWVGALNDGRIRVPVDGLTSVTAELARVLKHELTHSFLMQKTHGRCPVWLQEGVAEFMEGKRSHSAAAHLAAAYDQHMEISLSSYEGSWLNLPQQAATSAYAWSLAVVEAIVTQGSFGDIERILDLLASESAPEDAVRAALHESYADLMHSTVRYLHKAYL